MENILFNPEIEIKNYKINNYTESLVYKCIEDLFVLPRKVLYKWSHITKQTNHTKIGYTGQMLASVLLNVVGCNTGARGNDCMDNTEVKSCSRIDQSDKCTRCKQNISRHDKICPFCNKGDKIKRNNDSKWLLTIRSENDLKFYMNLDRLLLIIEDYPDFEKGNFTNIRIRAFEIYPKKEICKNFNKILIEYYQNIYLQNLNKSPKKVPAPKNFWPDSFQFHMCNPVEIFNCRVTNYLEDYSINIIKFIKPNESRKFNDIIKMPSLLLKKSEKNKENNMYISYNEIMDIELR